MGGTGPPATGQKLGAPLARRPVPKPKPSTTDREARQVDNPMQQQFATLATHHVLDGMSDQPAQFRQDPMTALLNQCHRARRGHDNGIDYMTVPF
jgi:hypothetical protein